MMNYGELENPDMDLCYCIPERIEEVSDSVIQSNGYDFLDAEEGQPGPLMGIWLQTENAGENWSIISNDQKVDSRNAAAFIFCPVFIFIIRFCFIY